MAVTSTRGTIISFAGDVNYSQQFNAGINAASPGYNQLIALINGANTIAVPAIVSVVPTAVVIIPPVGNTTSLVLKGITGDTGVRLHNTDPTTIALDPSVSSFVLTAGGSPITGLRLIWL
jgi:hypothetical protein